MFATGNCPSAELCGRLNMHQLDKREFKKLESAKDKIERQVEQLKGNLDTTLDQVSAALNSFERKVRSNLIKSNPKNT